MSKDQRDSSVILIAETESETTNTKAVLDMKNVYIGGITVSSGNTTNIQGNQTIINNNVPNQNSCHHNNGQNSANECSSTTPKQPSQNGMFFLLSPFIKFQETL